jgi:putative sterol carrier protein
MFGRQARPITAIGRPVELIPDSSLEKFNKNLRFIWKLAKDNIDKKKIEAISKHEEKIKKRKIEEFSVGCKVLVDTEVFKGKINRTEPIWTGPFEVAEVSDFALGIKKRGGRISKVNKSRCKLYVKT